MRPIALLVLSASMAGCRMTAAAPPSDVHAGDVNAGFRGVEKIEILAKGME